MKLRLEDDGGWIELSVSGYEFPEIQAGCAGTEFDYDANWLKLHCRWYMDGREFQGEEPCLLTVDIKRMIKELWRYRNGKRERIGCGGLEPNFALEIERRDGGDWLEVSFLAERGRDDVFDKACFGKWVSKRELDEVIRFWERALEAFPVR